MTIATVNYFSEWILNGTSAHERTIIVPYRKLCTVRIIITGVAKMCTKSRLFSYEKELGQNY